MNELGRRRWLHGAATVFLAALAADGRRRALFAFDDKERFNWHYVPRRREGLPFKDMSPAARSAAHELMKVSLSGAGYDKATNVIRLEGVLRRLETFGGLLRDPENYSVAVFGAPGPSAPWGWRLEGHHLSLNFTIVPGKPIAVTPAFLGANPAEVRTVSGPGRGDNLTSPVGVPAADLEGAQRELLVRLVDEYAQNMRADVAAEELRRVREAGLEHLHFAWAGPLEPGHAHYYRIHGPTLLIELDNTQNDANHIHTVWHDPRRDFGADLLRAHYQRGHRHA